MSCCNNKYFKIFIPVYLHISALLKIFYNTGQLCVLKHYKLSKKEKYVLFTKSNHKLGNFETKSASHVLLNRSAFKRA